MPPITYREWILKYRPQAEQRLHLRVAASRKWLDDMVEDMPGMAATADTTKESS